MEYVNFHNREISQIPSQDNPAYGDVECLLIVEEEMQPIPQPRRIVVIHIRPDIKKRTTHKEAVGIFWREDIAVQFCENFQEGDSMPKYEVSWIKKKTERYNGTVEAVDAATANQMIQDGEVTEGHLQHYEDEVDVLSVVRVVGHVE